MSLYMYIYIYIYTYIHKHTRHTRMSESMKSLELTWINAKFHKDIPIIPWNSIDSWYNFHGNKDIPVTNNSQRHSVLPSGND